MEVVKVSIGEKEWVVNKNALRSLLEINGRGGLNIMRGVIPDFQAFTCVGLEAIVRALNGENLRTKSFDFIPQEWEENFPMIKAASTNPRERAKNIREYIRRLFLCGETVTIARIRGLFPGLSDHTLRKHIQKAASQVKEQTSGGLAIEKMNNNYVPITLVFSKVREA